jgi:hypothetical protein
LPSYPGYHGIPDIHRLYGWQPSPPFAHRRPIRKYTNAQNIRLELRVPASLPYSRPGAAAGRLDPLPESQAKAIDKARPGEFVWPYRHHASPTTDPVDTVWPCHWWIMPSLGGSRRQVRIDALPNSV